MFFDLFGKKRIKELEGEVFELYERIDELLFNLEELKKRKF